jgi:HEAT repeat protein
MHSKNEVSFLTRVSSLVLCLSLGACIATGNPSYVDDMPSQAQITAKLKRASMPRELREQIIRLYHPDAGERAKAASQLGKMGPGATAAVPHLIRLLRDESPVQLSHYLGAGFRTGSDTTPGEEASRALAKIGGTASDALILALKDPHPGVRRLAAKALGQIGEITAVDFLIDLLGDRDRGVRATAAIALGNYRHPMATQKIMDAYPNAAPSVRADMVFALSHINDIMAVPFLVAHVDDEDPDVRAAIMLALGRLRDGRAVPALLSGLQDSDDITRANAAYGLGAYYAPEVVEALINALADLSTRVQHAAVESLTALTGLNFGMEQGKWKKWWQVQKQQMQSDHG